MGRTKPTDDELGITTRVWSVGGLSVLGIGFIGARTPAAFDAMATLASTPSSALLQADIGSAACEVGLGVLITAFLYLAALYLAYGAIVDLVSGFANKNSSSTKGQRQSSSDFKNGGTKMFGAVVVAGAPTILAGLGFTLLDCVDAVDIFSAVIVPLPL